MTSSCDYNSEAEFLDQLSDCHLLNKKQNLQIRQNFFEQALLAKSCDKRLKFFKFHLCTGYYPEGKFVAVCRQCLEKQLDSLRELCHKIRTVHTLLLHTSHLGLKGSRPNSCRSYGSARGECPLLCVLLKGLTFCAVTANRAPGDRHYSGLGTEHFTAVVTRLARIQYLTLFRFRLEITSLDRISCVTQSLQRHSWIMP